MPYQPDLLIEEVSLMTAVYVVGPLKIPKNFEIILK
jgi:hypothetical protein